MPTSTNAELIELSAVDAVAALRAGDISAQTYASALLERCVAGHYLNAFITLEPDRVLAAAHAADRQRAAGRPLGALHGLPMPVKDSVNTRGIVTTAGTSALRGWVPTADAPVITRLLGAGAIVLGKTNLHELSFGWTSNNLAFGAVRNPYDRGRIAGGSSGGTAAAVAARMAPLGLAEDTEGSIRVPAALCGICGFRPTTGRYPSQGVAPISALFDQVGPHARTVGDLALFDAVITGETTQVLPATLAGLRLGVPRGYYYEGLDPDVQRAMDDVFARLRAAGVVLVDAPVPRLGELVGLITGTVQIHDVVASLTNYLRASGAPVTFEQLLALVSPDVKGEFERYAVPGAKFAVADDTYRAARDVHLPALRRTFADHFAQNGLAASLFPTTMMPATPIGAADSVTIRGVKVPFATAISRNIAPGSTAGLPGLVLPAGLTVATRLPVGLELDGPVGRDRALLAIGMAIQPLLGALPAPMLMPA